MGARIGWSGGGGHFMVIYGYTEVLPPFIVNSDSLRGNVYKVDGIVGEQLGYFNNTRLISVEVNGEPVSIIVPPELRDVNVQKGQRLLFKVEVGDKGILKALGVKKA